MKVKILSMDGTKVVDLNRRRAIRERCLNCSGWHYTDVSECTSTDCPLYLYRMGTGKQDPKARAKAIREYCRWCCAGQVREVSRCTSGTCPLFAYRRSTTDKTVKIHDLSKKPHIDGSIEANFQNEYHSMGSNVRTQKTYAYSPLKGKNLQKCSFFEKDGYQHDTCTANC